MQSVWLRAVIVVLYVGLLDGLCLAQDCPSEVIQNNRESSVFIHVRRTFKTTGRVEEPTGSGFVLSPSGYVLTNDHLVGRPDDVDTVVVWGTIGSREATGELKMTLISEDKGLDIALLKFNDTSRKYKAVGLGDPTSVAVGTLICSVEFPLQVEYFHTKGSLSGLGGPHGYWYTDMPSNEGDSGAPVFVSSGGVVAMKVGGFDKAQNLNAIIPLNLAQGLLILVPDKHDALIHASWGQSPPLSTLPPQQIGCKCMATDAPNRTSYPLVNGYHTAPSGTVGKVFNRCSSEISVLMVKETIPNYPIPPLTSSAPGRSYFLAEMSPFQGVELDLSQSIGAALFPIKCPAEETEQVSPPPQVPINCVSDARLFPNVSPPGIPYVCPAQGPPGTQCNCAGHNGINYAGTPLPFP